MPTQMWIGFQRTILPADILKYCPCIIGALKVVTACMELGGLQSLHLFTALCFMPVLPCPILMVFLPPSHEATNNGLDTLESMSCMLSQLHYVNCVM